MSSKKRGGQKLGSSRRNRNRNPVAKESDDSFPQTGNEEHGSEQKDFHVVSEKQPADASVLPQLGEAATTCISQQISASELHPQSQDLLAQPETMSKRRKMGSTRKSNRGFKGGGIPEEEPEGTVEVSEGIREEYGVTEEVSVTGDDHQQSLSGYSSSQSIEPESSILQRQHWALGSTIHKEVLVNDGRLHLEIAFQSKPISLYFEPDQLQEAAFSEESISHSFNFSVATTTESKRPPHEFDDSLQMYQQMETLPNTTGQEKTGLTDRHLEEGRITTPAYDFEDVQVSQNTQIYSLVSSVNTIHDQFILNFMGEDKQRESTVSSQCIAEAEEERTQLSSASLINELEQGCSNSSEGLNSSTDGTEGAQTGTANEGISDHCLELKNETLKLTEDLACVQEFKMSEYREGEEEHREVHMVGDRKECDDVVEARFTMQTVEPDKSMTLSPKKKEGASSDQYLSYDTELHCDSPNNEITHHRDEQYDLSDARLLTGESSMGGNIGQTEHSVREQNNEEEGKKDREMRTEEEEAENGEAKLIDLIRKRKVIPFETLHEEEFDTMDISNQAYSLQHDDAGKFLSDMQSKEGACNDLQAGSDPLSEIEICHDTEHYEQEPFQSNDSMIDKEKGNDITENKNQFFEEIKPPKNICDTSALSIGEDRDNNSYTVVSDEAVELTKRKDLSAEDRMLLVYDSLDAEDKVSTEKELTTDHLMKRAEDDELSFPQQLQRKGACIKEDFDRDLEKDDKTLQGLSALAKEGDVIKNVEQTAQANVSDTYSGAHEDDTTSHLSEEESKAVDCVEVIAATVTNSALDLRDDLRTEVECVVTGDSIFSQAGENPVHPVSNKCSHITELASFYNTFDEKKENGMEGVIKEDIETETTNILQNDETLTTSFVYEGNKEIKEGNGAKPEYGLLDQENEGPEMNKTQYRGMNIAPTIIVDVAEYKIDSAVLEVQNNSGEVIDAMVQKNKSQENMETEQHGQGQIKKKRKFGSTRRPQSGHRPDTDIEEKLWKDVEATEEIKHDDQNRYSEETTRQAVSQTSVSEVSLGNTDLHSETETVEMIDTTPVILSNAIVCQVDTVVLEENSKAEDPQEITEYEKSTAEDKRTDDSTHSDEQKMSSIITKIPNDTSTYYNRPQEAFMADQDPDMERTDNGSSSQVDASPTSGTMEFISPTQGSLDMLANTESTYDFASDIIRQMSWNLGISVDHLNQPTSRESELESTCSFILIQESKTTEDDVTTNHAELSTLGTKTGLIQRTEQHHEGDQKENIEETSENEGKRGKKDDEGRHGEKKDVPLADSSKISSRKSEVIEEENKETTEETHSAPTEKSATEEFTAVCSEQYMNPGLSSETTKWVLTTNIQTSQGAELSDSKDNDRNIEENAEITGPQAQNQSKKKRKTGSTRRLQGGQRPDTEGKERKWKDVEAAEEFEHDKEERCSKETTCQAATVNSLTESQIAVSEVSLGILDLTLEKEITKSKDETESTDIVHHYINNELSKVEEQVEIIEEHPQSVEDDEKASKPTSSDKQEMPPVIMKTQKDTSIYHDFSQEASMVVKECNVESSENRSPSHAHASLISGIMELISEIQDGLDIPKNIENTETASDQMRQLPWDHNISENHLDLPTNRDSELEQNESTCSLVHKQESKNAQDDVITENSELNTSGKGGKMEPTQKSHRKQFHGYELDNSVQEINEKDRESGEKDYEDMYGEEKDVHLMDRFNRPSSKNETESEETKEVINAGPAKDSNTEDFIAVCSEQYKYSGTSSQVTELGLTTTIQPSPVVIYPDFKEDGEISEDDIEIRDAELHTQNQSKKKRKFGSTRRPQGGHNPNNDREERKWKDVEVTGEFEHNEEERRSKNTIHEAATLNSLTEPQIAVSEVSLGVLDPPVKKEMTESKDETALADVVHHIDNEVSRGEELVEIRHTVVEYERDDESTSTDKQKMAAVITEIEIDTSTYQTSSQEASMVVEKVGIENTENGNPSQVLSSPTCGTMEFISKIQQSLDISLNAENTHEVASYGIKHLAWDQSIPEDHLEQHKRKSEAEQFGNSSTLNHTQQSKTIQGDEITENSDPSTSGKPRKMGSNKRSHKGRVHERDQKNPTEEISKKEEKRGYEDNEAKYGEEKDVHLTEISSLSSRKHEDIEEENIVDQHTNNEVHKTEKLVEIIEEHGQSVEEDERGDESTSSDNQTVPPVVTEIQNDVSSYLDSTQEVSIIVEGHDMKSTENRSQVHDYATCGTVELISEVQDETNAHEFVSEQIGQLPCDKSISKDHLDQPTNEDPELEKVESTCSLVHIEEPKTTQENVMTENLELSTSGKWRKMGSTRRSHREPLHGGGLKESSEEINEKERESNEKDNEDNVHLTERSDISSRKKDLVEEESEETKDQLKASPTEDSTTEDFIAVCSEQYMDSGLSSQTTELGLATNIKPSPVTEHSDSKEDDGGNSKENVEIKNTVLHTQNQSKKKRKRGSTQRHQAGHRPDNEVEERRWKDVESTEEIEDVEEERRSKEATNQTATSELLTEPQSAVSEVSLGILGPPLEKEIIQSNDETEGRGIIDRPHVILTDTLLHHSNNEVRKVEELVEIIEEHEQSVVEDERGDESTSSETIPPVVTEIQNDVSTFHDFSQEASIIVEGHDMESNENKSPSQAHLTPTCGTVELISEAQDSLGNPVNTENTHELVSEQIGQLPFVDSISNNQQDQPTNEDPELEKVESTCSLVHVEEPKITQENVMIENLELSTSEKQRKMGSTRRSHREPLHGGSLKESTEEINEKERESNEKDNEDNVHLTERLNVSSRKKDIVEEESEEIKDELKASPTEDSTTEDFIAVCSEQYMDSGLSSQTTELGVSTNIQPSPSHSYPMEDDGNGEENIEVKNAELQVQSQSKKKKKTRSTQRPQGGHRRDNDGKERKWKNVEATEQTEYDEEDRCSKETTNQAASSDLFAEPQCVVSEESLGILHPTLNKDTTKSNDETTGCGMIDISHVISTDIVVQHTDNEVHKTEKLVEIIEEHGQSVEEDERGDESTSSDNQTVPPVVTEIQNDVSSYLDSTQEVSIIVEGHDMKSTENRSQVHDYATCGTVELISEVQDIKTNAHEFVSEQIGQLPCDKSISKDHLDQPANEDPELEKVESTCSLIHTEQPKTTQENVMTENLELSTSGKRKKMGSTRRSHREPLRGGGLKESSEEINEKERESNEKDNEDDVHLTERSNISSRKKDVVEEESEEIKNELKASPTEDSTTEDFIAVCSEQDIDSGLSSQTTELGLTTNLQPSPVSEHSDYEEEDGNGEENIEVKNAELEAQSQSKKKKKFGSTRRPQGRHRPVNEEERKRKEATEETQHDKEEKCSKEAKSQAASSYFLTEPQNAVNGESLGILDPTLEKEIAESKDETGGCGMIDTSHVILTDIVVQHTDNEVQNALELVEIVEEQRQSVVGYERDEECTFSDKQKIPPVVTEIQNDTSTYNDFSKVAEECDIESKENRSFSQVHVTPICGTVELISEVQDSLGIPVNTENTHEFVSEQIGQLPSDESISKDQLDQPTNEDPELEKVKSTCSLIHIEEPKTTQENVMTENVELSTSGKRRKMGSTRRSHREPLHGGGLKESTEEINEKERESNEKDNEDMYGEEKDVHLTETSDKSIRKNDVVEESEEIKEELKASPTEDSTTEDFIEVCSEQDMHFGLSSQTIELGLATNIQPSPVTEHSDSKDDGGNSEENVEIKSTELHTQNQSKEKRKFGSTQRHQGGHRPDNEVEERRWKDVESTEEIEDVEEERCSKEATNQAATSELLTEPQSAVSEVSLGILGPPLKKEMIESNDETGGCGIIDRPHVILTDTLLHHSNNEVNKAEELMEIIEECEQSVVEDERGDESTSSETIPPVVTEIENDVSTFHDFSQEASIIVEGHDMESNENKSPSQAHLTPTCGTVELISEAQDSLGNPVNTENTHELVSEQIGQLPFVDSISNNQQDQPTNEDPELEKVESTCSLVHVEEPKITQENVMIENLELSTSEKRRKMGSTRRSHREPLHGGSLKESTEEINEKERESNEKDNEDDVHLTERSNISSRKKDVVEEESEEIKNELKASPTEDSTTEDFIAVCSEQDIDSGLSSQTTELGLTTNLQPSPVSEHSDYEEEDGNGEENIEVKNAELEAQSQSKKKKKFGSTRRPQGRHRPVNEEERKRKEATEETQHDKEEKCSKEAKSQAASSYFLTEPQNAVNGESLGILDPTLEKEIAESKDETGGCGMIDTSHVILTDIVVQHTDNEVQNALELVEIVEEQRQSVVGYERDEECTFSDKQKIPPVVTEIQNDTSTYNDFSKVAEECDIESKENRSFSQVHVTPICGTVELISEVQDSLGIPVNTENTHEFVSEQIGQLPSDESISKDQLDQPTNEDPELEKVKSTCSLIHIEEPKTTQENVMTENVELSTSGKRRKMGSTRRSHREPLHGGGLKESTEEINEKERESNEKDNEDMYGEEKDVHLTETSDKSIRKNDVVEESEEIKEELKASPTEDSTTEDFIEVCSEQDMHFGLSSQTIELGLATNIQPSPVTEHSDSKDDGGNSEENVEIKSTELHTQNQSKEKRKFGSTQRHQGGHRPDNEVEERRWKDVESTEEIEDVEEERCSKEATNQAATSELLTEPQSAVSEVSLGILGPPLKKEMIESNDETGGCGIIDRPHVILTDTLLHHSNNEVNKAEELMEIVEECEQSVVEDERGDESTSSETIPPVVTEIENDVSTYHYFSQEASIIVEGHDMERNENRSPSQVHVTLKCGTVELISEVQDRLGNPVNTENTHELLSEQIRQLPSDESTSKDQIDQPTNKDPELEKVESTCSLVHIEQPNTTQENVMIENLELSTSGKRRKMGSTRRTHRAPLHGGDLKETIEGINGKERESGEKHDEDMYGVEKDVPLTERSSISSRKKDVVEEESEEIKDKLKASPTEDSTTEDFIAVCSEQYMDSGLFSQTTELGLITNIQRFPVSEHSDSEEDDGNGEENIEVKNAELQTQSQSKEKKKFRSTRRPQGRYRRDNEEEERKWKNVEAIERAEHDEEEKCSKEANSQAASSDFLTESQNAVSGESLVILYPTLEKEIAESKDETGGCGMIDTSHVILTDIVVQHTDNEVQNALELVEIFGEHRQSVVGYERDEECTFSDKQKIPPVVTEIQNDTSKYHDFSEGVEECDIESNENRNRSQVHVTPRCGTVELISEAQDSLGFPVNTENTHELLSEQIGQLPSDESISKAHLDQPTNKDPELEKVKSTCSLIHIEEPKTTQENVMIENLELSTSGKRRKMGSTRRSHREPLRGCGLKESSEEINEKERESDEKDDEDMNGEEKDLFHTETSNISIRKNEVVEEESDEIKEELEASPTEHSTTEDFIEVGSEQDMHCGLSPQSTQLGLTTNIQPSPMTEHSNSKDDGGNSEENVEIKNTKLHTQSQSKKRRKFGSTRRPQGGHRPDNKGEERKWKDVESTEKIEDDEEERHSKETTHQAATSELLTEPQSAVSEVSLGIPVPPLEKEMIESNDETEGCGIIDRPHVILTDTLLHYSDNEVRKVEELVEIIEEREQSVVEDETGDESTSSNKQKIPQVIKEIQNDVSTYLDSFQEASIIVKGYDMESHENRSLSQVHVTPTCGIVELISEVQDSLAIPVNPENAHELVSEQIGQLPSDESTSKDQLDQSSNEDPVLEKVKSTCSLIHREETKITQENVMTENVELSTSGKQRKMGSTRRSHKERLHGGDLKETIEAINEKEREKDEKDDEDMYGEEKDLLHTETSNKSIRKNEVVEEESDEIKEELEASPTEHSTNEDFIEVCSEQDMHCGLSPQSTQLGLTTNMQPSPMTEHLNSKDDGGNSKENVEIINIKLHTQNQSEKKRKFGSTRRHQGGHRPDNEVEERRWKDVESTEEIEDVEEERCSTETTHQAATSELLTEPQSAVSEMLLGIPEPPLEKEMIESNDETGGCGIIDRPHVILTDTLLHHSDNEIRKVEELVEIIEEREQSVVEDEAGDESTSSNKQKILQVIKEIQNDVSTYLDSFQEASIIVKGYDMESHENRSLSQVHVTPTCGTVELISKVQDSLAIPVNPENAHELVSEQIGQLPSDESTSKDQLDQPSNEDPVLEKVKSTCSLIHREETKTTQENVMIENLELSTSGKRRKMGSTRRSHRERLHGGDLKETIEEINEKEREKGEKDDEDMYGEEKDVYLKERSYISIRKNEAVEAESEEIKDKLKASPTEDSTTEDFTEVCSEQDMHSGLSPQTTELDLISNIQPSPVTKHSDSREDDGNSKENVKIRNADLQTQSQSKKKRKFGSTRRPQGVQILDTEEEERRWKDVEATEGLEHDEKERCSEETHQAVTSNLLTESLNAGSEVSLGILIEEMKEKESSKEQTVDESAPITEESNSEVERLSFIPTIPTETCHQSIERQSEPSESITIIRPELEKLDKKKRKMGSTRKNFKGGDAKKPWDRGTGDMDPTSDEDITKEETKSTARVDTVLDDKGFGRSVIIEMIGQEHELQTPHMLDQSEGSLLGEIEYELKKSCQSPLNTIAHSISEEISESSLNKPLETHNNQHNILEIPEPKDEQCKSTLKLPASQSSQTHTEPSSPGRRRKMGSTRKTPRNKHTEEPRDESRDTEQDTETQDTLGTNSDLERETTMLTAKVHAVPQVDENNTDHPIPGGRRKFGSRRTAKGELMLNQKETEAGQVLTDELTVDPYFIPGPESIPVSQLTSDHEDTKASPSNEQNEKSVVNEADKSTRTGLASFGDLRRSSLYNGSTGRREIIDFERWDEQIPDFGVAVYNVVMVGNCNVGKTSFIRRFQSGLFSKDYGSTIGVDTFVQTITLGNRTVKLHIWDTAGQERYHSITRQVFHKAQGLLLMYDITSSQSFYAVRKWISQIQERAPADVTMMLLGNKNDCAEREVQLKEGEDLSRDYNIHFMECSVATGENVSESMKSLAWLLVKQNVRREEEQAILQPKQPQKKSGCC
ncbi:hypothetical protein SRHO_G00299000 [Serrasalmus rhombeus]